MNRDDALMRHWRHCPECRRELREGAPQMHCETYLRLIGVLSLAESLARREGA